MEQRNKSRRGFFRRIGPTIAYLFRGVPFTEGYVEQTVESVWEEDYQRVDVSNYTEIFANRLTNYALYGGSIFADDEEIDKCVQGLMKKARKICIWSLAVGRSYIVPYVSGGIVYSDIIPQSRSVVTRRRGDDILGFACLSDIREVNKHRYARWTLYDYDPTAKVFSITNKATRYDNNAEVALKTVEEWADILPYIQFSGVEKPLFAFVDSPRDNRETDMMQGASITFGAKNTINELDRNAEDFYSEFDKKRVRLGVDRSMLDKGQTLESYVMPVMASRAGGNGASDLFAVFDPQMRDASYLARQDALLSRLEKQVGTSSGILTNAESAMATATQVRRAMFDTTAMVDAIRKSFEDAVDVLKYSYAVYLSLIGIRANGECTVTASWSQAYIEDDLERFNKIQQGHSAGIVSDVEYRREIYPNETPEEAEEALRKIREESETNEMVLGADGGDGGNDPFTEQPTDDNDALTNDGEE